MHVRGQDLTLDLHATLLQQGKVVNEARVIRALYGWVDASRHPLAELGRLPEERRQEVQLLGSCLDGRSGESVVEISMI